MMYGPPTPSQVIGLCVEEVKKEVKSWLFDRVVGASTVRAEKAEAALDELRVSHESRRQRASLAIAHLRGAFRLRAGTQQVEDATQQAAEQHSMARERIADLEHYVGEHLSATGICDQTGDDSEESLCTDSSCTYCEMARALQPIECGRPLRPREVSDA